MSSNKVTFFSFLICDTTDLPFFFVLNFFKELLLNTWMHVVCRCDAKNKTLSLFIDGELDATLSLSSDLKWNNHPLYIGKLSDGVI